MKINTATSTTKPAVKLKELETRSNPRGGSGGGAGKLTIGSQSSGSGSGKLTIINP
jgi:hypothetical protein